jgi:alkylation response protein AidB-like acyl-CoA dehydrogenase
MDMKLSQSEAALQAELRDWLASHYDFAAVLARTASGQSRDAKLWDGLVARGWIAGALPRRDDIEQSVIDAAIIAEEFGRALVIEPFFRSTYLAACLILEAAPTPGGDEWLGRIRRAESRFACALYEPDSRFWLDQIRTRAEAHGNLWRLTGRKAMVLDGADADHILVTARTPEGATGLFLVTGETDGLTRTRFHTIDDFAAADLAFDGAEATAIALGASVPSAIQDAVDRTITVLGAETLGAAAAALDETAHYTGQREQFGRKIATFQVVAHRLARMFAELEGLRGGLIEALSVAGASAGERAQAASGLKVLMSENGRFVVNQAIQLHGGVGTVNEYKVSHCFKRVFAADILFGNGDFHLERYAKAMA